MGEQSPESINPRRSFEERVFARFDVLDLNIRDMESSIRSMEARLQRIEQRTFDAKPIAEQVHKEIVEIRRELTKGLDRIEAIVLKSRSDLSEVDESSPGRLSLVLRSNFDSACERAGAFSRLFVSCFSVCSLRIVSWLTLACDEKENPRRNTNKNQKLHESFEV